MEDLAIKGQDVSICGEPLWSREGGCFFLLVSWVVWGGKQKEVRLQTESEPVIVVSFFPFFVISLLVILQAFLGHDFQLVSFKSSTPNICLLQ